MNNEKEVFLRIDGISKAFGPTKAVVDAKIEISQGEVRGLIGENGSGKSTLSAIIAGMLKADSGKMFLENIEYNPLNVIEARKKGVSIITQEVGTINDLTVAENIFLGKEGHFSKTGHVYKKKMVAASKKILNEIGASHIDPLVSINSVSFEDRKLIEVAMAMYNKPRLLILDETVTALTYKGRELIYKLIEDLKNDGRTVIFISHDLAELETVSDKITVLRDGKVVKTLLKNEINVDLMRQLMIGRDLEGHYYRADHEPKYEKEVVLHVDNISLGTKLWDISLKLHKGEILGIGGLTDCGMHELGKVMFGVNKPDSGTVTVMPQNAEIRKASIAVKNKIGYMPKNREREAMMLAASVKDNVVLMSLDKLKRGTLITRKSEKQLAYKMADALNIKMVSANQLCAYLSGGNKQKVILAKWLANDSRILIMDCPTRGIDVGVKAAIYQLMNDIKKSGKSIIMISEELPELLGMADRIIVMKNGKVSGSFLRSPIWNESMIIQKVI